METREGFTLIELLIVIAIIAVLAAILFPVFARARASAQASDCQSNMKQIGKAIKMYVTDWQGTFPTNRPYSNKNRSALGGVSQCVPLSPVEIDQATGKPRQFESGITWVEGLYSYIEQVTKNSNPASVWKCGSSSNAADPSDPTYNSSVHFVFNGCLVEIKEGTANNQSNLMMVREFGRLTASTLRPTNPGATHNPNEAPQFALLNESDCGPNMTDTSRMCKIHSGGSHVLFADGHVKGYGLEFFPSAMTWDPITQQWYNYRWEDPPTDKRQLNLSIAVTP